MIQICSTLIAVTCTVVLINGTPEQRRRIMPTDERIAVHNYPVEIHKVQTSDGYILTMFRIPFSPKSQKKHRRKPVVLLLHGLISSSDSWIFNGPNNALPYLLADGEYDVWLGNHRGNTYSKEHSRISNLLPDYWAFSWHEIGLYDLSKMIDYILEYTDENGIHYVAHSQGTTDMLVLLSTYPKYNSIIKTSHFLAPVAYLNNSQSALHRMLTTLGGYPSILHYLIGRMEFLPQIHPLAVMATAQCNVAPVMQYICRNFILLLMGWDSKQLNNSIVTEAIETHPSGTSGGEIIHYLQLMKSGYFRQYDYGFAGNILKYDRIDPPQYDLSRVTAPIRLYYGDNDQFVDAVDVLRLASNLPNLIYSYRIPNPEWTHADFLWAMSVRHEVYDKIVASMNFYEATGIQR